MSGSYLLFVLADHVVGLSVRCDLNLCPVQASLAVRGREGHSSKGPQRLPQMGCGAGGAAAAYQVRDERQILRSRIPANFA